MTTTKKLTTSQAANLTRLMTRLTEAAKTNDSMKAGLTDEKGLVAFWAEKAGMNVTFSAPFGSEPVMMWEGSMVTRFNVNRIANVVNNSFGPMFYNEVLENGQSANVPVSIMNDVLPHLRAYQEKHDRELPLRKLKVEREQVRMLLKIADAPVSDTIKKNIPVTTVARWRTLEKHLTAEIAKVESFG